MLRIAMKSINFVEPDGGEVTEACLEAWFVLDLNKNREFSMELRSIKK